MLITSGAIGRVEFRDYRYDDQSGTLQEEHQYELCADGNYNYMGGILTRNRYVPPPTVGPSLTPSATSPTPGAEDTATSVPLTPTATTTAISTASPGRAFLPVVLNERCVPEEEHADIVLVMDASTSMLDLAGGGNTKMVLALEAAHRLVDTLSRGDQAAVISFNDTVTVQQELTGDPAAVAQALANIQNSPHTRIDLGIQAARLELESSRHVQGNNVVMVVLTDGKANPVPVDVAVGEAELAKSRGITVFTVGLGEAADLDWWLSGRWPAEPLLLRDPKRQDLAGIYEEIAVSCLVQRRGIGDGG